MANHAIPPYFRYIDAKKGRHRIILNTLGKQILQYSKNKHVHCSPVLGTPNRPHQGGDPSVDSSSSCRLPLITTETLTRYLHSTKWTWILSSSKCKPFKLDGEIQQITPKFWVFEPLKRSTCAESATMSMTIQSLFHIGRRPNLGPEGTVDLTLVFFWKVVICKSNNPFDQKSTDSRELSSLWCSHNKKRTRVLTPCFL